MRKFLLWLLATLMIVPLILVFSVGGCKVTPTEEVVEEAQAEEIPTEEVAEEAPAEEVEEEEEAAEALVHSNLDEFTKIQDQVDLKAYYAEYGVDCECTFTGSGGVVSVKGLPEKLPTPNEKYTIGLALYYTVDEVGAFILEGSQKIADEMGIELLINDANYDQVKQDQAIEQWILQDVDGVIFYPADFNACGPILQKLKDANIPVMAGNPPLTPSEVVSVFTIDNIAIGQGGAQLIIDTLEVQGRPLEGTVIFQNIPFLHPNAATRKGGFLEVTAKYPLIKVIELTGLSPEDHYTAFESAIQAHPDLIGAWGLYSSAVIGMANAKKAAGRDDIILTGVDQDRPILSGIYNGEITGTVGYAPYHHAYWTICNLVNILNGVPDVPGNIIGPIETVTKDNVEELFEYYYGGRTLQDYLAGK